VARSATREPAGDGPRGRRYGRGAAGGGREPGRLTRREPGRLTRREPGRLTRREPAAGRGRSAVAGRTGRTPDASYRQNGENY